MTISENIENNLDNIEARIRDRNLDWVHVNCGEEGSTKSSLSLLMADYIDSDFDVEKQVALNGEEFREKARNLAPFKPIIYDEGIEGLYSSDHMKKESKKTVKFFRQCRELNLIIFVNLPVFKELNKKIRRYRVKSVTRCVKQGWGHFYGKKEKNEFLDKGEWPDPPMRGSWKDPAEVTNDLWKDYQDYKEKNLRREESNEEVKEVDKWLSVGDFADRIGASNDTIRNWCNDGKLKHGRLPNGDRRIPETEIERVVQDPVSPEAK